MRGKSLDETLLLAERVDRIPGGIKSGCKAASETTRPFQTALAGLTSSCDADDALPVADQVIEQVKTLRCDRNCLRRLDVASTPFCVERVILKEIAQVAISSGVTSGALSSTKTKLAIREM